MTVSWQAAQSEAEHWGLAVKTCLDKLSLEDANFGLVYVTAEFAEELSSIVTFLRETTPIGTWAGAAAHGVFGPEGEVYEGRALVMMVGRLPPEQVRPFSGFTPLNGGDFRKAHQSWLDEQESVTALVHGDGGDPGLISSLRALAEAGDAFLIGGVTAARMAAGADGARQDDTGLSGVLLGGGLPLLTSLSQGCAPIGPVHRVTEALDNVVMRLDGRPALSVLKDEAGEIIARDLKRAAGYIHVARPVEGSDNGEYMVRGLLGVDPDHGWMAVGERMTPGDHLFFVRRDPKSAQTDFRRMLDRMVERTKGRTIRGGLYISCFSRGSAMFGGASETALIHAKLGDFPLVGFSAAGEISGDRLHGYSGVLALFF